MVQGLKFLSKKGFNPQNNVNRKRVYEAQQDSKLEQERIRRRNDELKRERDDAELCRMQHGNGSQAQLRFMYDAPPGMEKSKSSTNEPGESDKRSSSSNDVTQIQPGDDAAAAAFRKLLASSVNTQHDTAEEDTEGITQSALKYGAVMQGSTMDPMLESNKQTQGGDARSALEKAVGRKDRGGALTLEEHIARFPQLKYAPMAKGMSSTDVNVSFKPLGSQLRNVKCLACGIWGHSRGDRECSKTGWNPFDLQRPIAPAVDSTSSIQPRQEEKRISNGDDDDDDASTSSASSEDSRRRRKRKHKSKKKKKRHKESKRHRRRRSRSESPRRRRSRSSSPRDRRKRSRKY